MMPAIKLTLVLVFATLLGVPALAEESVLDRILAARNLRVCIWPDYFGISYRDPKTQLLSGIDIDMASAVQPQPAHA